MVFTMKIRNGYMLRQIAGVSYILPVGQNIADHRRGIKLNESGLLLWNALQNQADEEELLSLLMQQYEADASDESLFREDIRHFLMQLTTLGIIYGTEASAPSSFEHYFQIGTLTLGYHGPEELIHPSFFDFACAPSQPDQAIRIIPSAPAVHPNGEILVRTKELTICKNDAHYLFLYPEGFQVAECRLSLDGSIADFYCRSPFDEKAREDLFHAIRFTFLVKAQMEGLFALHSASILYQDRAWLFAGSSGTGKSTHAALWERLFETPLLNGDLNLIGISGDVPVVYGIPWCGTSGIYTTKTYPLGGITLLKRAAENGALPMTEDERQLKVMHRLISPSWTNDMLSRNLDFAADLQTRIPVFCLQCTKETAAAHTMKQIIDDSLSGPNED